MQKNEFNYHMITINQIISIYKWLYNQAKKNQQTISK